MYRMLPMLAALGLTMLLPQGAARAELPLIEGRFFMVFKVHGRGDYFVLDQARKKARAYGIDCPVFAEGDDNEPVSKWAPMPPTVTNLGCKRGPYLLHAWSDAEKHAVYFSVISDVLDRPTVVHARFRAVLEELVAVAQRNHEVDSICFSEEGQPGPQCQM